MVGTRPTLPGSAARSCPAASRSVGPEIGSRLVACAEQLVGCPGLQRARGVVGLGKAAEQRQDDGQQRQSGVHQFALPSAMISMRRKARLGGGSRL